jgi:aspartyl-tRNA(Asn)/glutamyl-tRNA(Gln) amidotransferase subunit C
MADIKGYEKTAKLNFTEAELGPALGIVEMLIKSFDELEKTDTDSTEPLVTVLDVKNILREDTVAKHITREELLSNAPEQYDGYFQVPKAVD